MAEKKGWHRNSKSPPHKGVVGGATVEPIRLKRNIRKIKEVLGDHARDLALFTLGINTGLRGSDLLSLRFKDVLTKEDKIVSKLEVVETKTKKKRKIKLGPKPRKALMALLPNDLDDLDVNAYLFPSRKGGRMTIQRLHQLLNTWCDKAGVKGHFGSHTLRKSYGYHLYKNGADIVLLMKAFGHSNQAVTLRYIGIEDEQIDEANLNLNL
jgi:integrase